MMDELDDLQNPENWDEGNVRPPVKAPRAVVSVAFSREDFERIVAAARARGMKTSEFIRYAALAEAAGARQPSGPITVSGMAHTTHPQPASRAAKATVSVNEQPESYTTG